MSLSIIGHDRQIAYINNVHALGRLPHAYLFHGPEHVGKLTIALALAQSFFCQDAQEDLRRVCGGCASCRAIAQYRHPDVIILDLEHTLVSEKEVRKEIPIEDIRELKRKFSFAPAGSGWRLAIINQADKMSEEAANAFLKLLEEPGANTLLILITPHKDLLLPTIVSRAQSIGFLTLSDAALADMIDIKAIAVSNRNDLLTLAGGRPGMLIRLCEKTTSMEDEKKMFQHIQKIVRDRDMVSALRISEQVAQGKESRENIIYWLASMLRQDLLQNTDHSESVADKLMRIDHIGNLIDFTNVNPRLAMDVMFLECMQ